MTKQGNLSINSDNLFPIIKKWLYSDQDIFIRELVSNGCDAITKLRKLEVIGEYKFDEDQEFATIPLCRATKIKVVDDPLYIYRIGDVNQSVSTASQLRRLPDFEKVLFKMMEFEAHLDELPEGGADYWTRKVSKFIADIYQITLVKNTDKKGQRKYIKDLNRRINEKSPRVFAFVKNKYRVFAILNRFHMSDETYNGGFTRLLAWARKHLHVDKLYG